MLQPLLPLSAGRTVVEIETHGGSSQHSSRNDGSGVSTSGTGYASLKAGKGAQPSATTASTAAAAATAAPTAPSVAAAAAAAAAAIALAPPTAHPHVRPVTPAPEAKPTVKSRKSSMGSTGDLIALKGPSFDGTGVPPGDSPPGIAQQGNADTLSVHPHCPFITSCLANLPIESVHPQGADTGSLVVLALCQSRIVTQGHAVGRSDVVIRSHHWPWCPVPGAALLSAAGQDEDDDFCSTCLEAYSEENPKVWTECGHHFHLPCIYAWLERKTTCPYCESPMNFPGQ
ncbi:MAG: hypothetical protein WDW38_004621 [Sanguina aurantia]